jgi:hypothetical protein
VTPSGFGQQSLEHGVLAAALGEAWAIFLSQRSDPRIAVLALDPPAFVAMTMVETRP